VTALFGDGLFAPAVVSDELIALTGDGAWLQALLDAEAGLARAGADAGVLPPEAAEAIAGHCHAAAFDAGEIGRAARLGGNPVIPLVKALTAAVPSPARTWVHWGATSQDILDTAAMLVARRALVAVERDLGAVADGCAELADRHRHTVMAGRTLLQQALPITFGGKAAAWLVGVLDARRLVAAAGDGLAVQLGGAAGTLASLDGAGPTVVACFARRLGLGEPLVPWHTARQRIAALGAALATATATAAKISGDVALLMQTEIAEAAEPAGEGRGGSSTLPHKRNPVAAAAVATATRRATALLPLLVGAVVAEHERPLGAWQAEWLALGELLALAGGAAAHTAETLAGLEVDPAAMAANLDRAGGLLLAERVTFALAEVLERAEAAALVTAAAGRVSAGACDFAEALAAEPRIAEVLDRPRIDELLQPSGYLGASETWIDRALAAHRAAPPPTDRAEAPPPTERTEAPPPTDRTEEAG
jgi:3-carboxy-cis,cis-muconate cycloisomerase